MMNFHDAKKCRDSLEAVVKATTLRLKSIPGIGSGPMGLTPDRVRQSREYSQALTASNRAFAELQAFNRWFVREFAAEIRKDKLQRQPLRKA